MRGLGITVILLLYCFGCSNPKAATIEIIIRNNNFTVNGELIAYDSLGPVLKREKAKLIGQQPSVTLKVDHGTKRGMLADVETILRKLNVRKVYYTDLDDRK